MTTVGSLVARQGWLDPAGDWLGRTVANAFAAGGETGRRVKDVLNGVWLGHPLHPVLTDIPVGAWSMAALFDALDTMTPSDASRTAASVCVNVGLAGAVAAAITGLTDWSDTNGESRRVGLVHGLLNLTAAGLYAASAIARSRRQDDAGRSTAYAGYALASVSAYLGGDLVYHRQIGVDHAVDVSLPDGFTRVLAESELPEGAARKVMVGDAAVLLARRGGRICALADRCAHQGGPLSEGELDETSVTCPWHGSRFALEDGSILNGPSTFPQPCFEARVTDGFIEVRQS